MFSLHFVFCVTIRFLLFTLIDIYRVAICNCFEVVIGRMQLEGCAIVGCDEFQGAGLALAGAHQWGHMVGRM